MASSSTKNNPLLPMTTTIDSPPPRMEEKLFKGSAMTKRGAYAAISYMSCAVLLVLFNKAALSSYNFPSANVITLCQIICSCCFLYLLRRLKLISFHLSESLATPDNFKTFVPLKTLIDTLPVAVTYLLYMVRGTVVLLLEGKSSGLNSFGLMWCNGIVCGPFLLVWSLIRGDLALTMDFPYLFSPGFLVVMLMSCILAFFLNYSIFLNTTLNSAVTQTICGNLKDIFTISLGWFIFGGLPFDLLNVLGQLLGFVGSGLYAYYKLMGK